MAARGAWRRIKRDYGPYLPLAPYLFVVLFPFYWMVITAFKRDRDLYNLETAPFGEERSASAAVGYGSYDTRRLMIQLDSGPLAGGWNLYGRYSRIESDGYRDQSWTRLWSYDLSARRLFGRHSLRLNLFGGPETTHLAYKGVPSPYLDGTISGDPERDRRVNLLAYPGEADHFFEPHYELLHSWSPRDGVAISQTLFWFDGEGYYDEQRLDSLGAYRLTPWAADTTLYPDLYFQDAYGNRARDAESPWWSPRSAPPRRPPDRHGSRR